MRAPDTDEASDDIKEITKSKHLEKRDRDRVNVSQQAGQASGTDERPPKTRKVIAAIQEDDPVAFARRALEMFRKEVESDGDYEEPDTRPGEIDTDALNKEKVTPKGILQKANKSAVPPASAEDGGVSRWQKIRQHPMISHEDDPSIL